MKGTQDGSVTARDGFTLIELLVVIVILGILAGIVVFAVGDITDRGQTSACDSDRKAIETAEEAYFADHNSYATVGTLVPDYLHEMPSLHIVKRTSAAAMTDGAKTYVVLPADATCTS